MQQVSPIRLPDGTEVLPVPNTVAPSSRPDDDVLDVRFLVQLLWRGKWIILLVMLLAGVMGIRDMLAFTPQYEATMIVDPNTGDGAQSGSASQASSVARTIGLNLANKAQATVFSRLEILVSSITMAELLQEKYGLLQRIYASSWNSSTQTWLQPTGDRFEWEQEIRKKLNMRQWSPPNTESFSDYLRGVFKVDDEKEGAFKKITVRDTNPEFALFLLKTIYFEADNLIRQQDREQSMRRKQYLEKQLQQATLAEARVMLVGLLSSEEQRAMLLTGDFPYAAKIVVPAHVSNQPTNARILDLTVKVGAALLAACTLVVLIGLFRRE